MSKSMHVDDLISGEETTENLMQLKEPVTKIFNDATFKLHKWHSNVPVLESEQCQQLPPTYETFAKQQLGVRPDQAALLS